MSRGSNPDPNRSKYTRRLNALEQRLGLLERKVSTYDNFLKSQLQMQADAIKIVKAAAQGYNVSNTSRSACKLQCCQRHHCNDPRMDVAIHQGRNSRLPGAT